MLPDGLTDTWGHVRSEEEAAAAAAAAQAAARGGGPPLPKQVRLAGGRACRVAGSLPSPPAAAPPPSALLHPSATMRTPATSHHPTPHSHTPCRRCWWSTMSGSWCPRRSSTPQVTHNQLGVAPDLLALLVSRPAASRRCWAWRAPRRCCSTPQAGRAAASPAPPAGPSPPARCPSPPARCPSPPARGRHWDGGGRGGGDHRAGGAGLPPAPARAALVKRAAHGCARARAPTCGAAGASGSRPCRQFGRRQRRVLRAQLAAVACISSGLPRARTPPNPRPPTPNPSSLSQAARAAAPASESACMRSCGRWCLMITRWAATATLGRRGVGPRRRLHSCQAGRGCGSLACLWHVAYCL